ncbi:MAG: carbohydrate ABC transporter permease [Epulopiscium sp.]|nr:carbohydrate ABC transporter permease [Candidatus Epulonipiscium sp.]
MVKQGRVEQKSQKGILGWKKVGIHIVAIFLSLLSVLPFWIMLMNATRSTTAIQAGISLFPSSFLKSNWDVLTGKGFNAVRGIINSSIIAFGSTGLSVYFSTLTAYGLTVYRFKGRDLLFSFIIGIIMIPTQLNLIGFYQFMLRLGLTNSFIPLIIPAIASPATVFFMRQYLVATMPFDIIESARIDGAGEFRIFNIMTIPIMKPAIATMSIFGVVTSWNNFLTPLTLLTNEKKYTLPLMVQMLKGDIYKTEYGGIYLGISLTILPLLVIYFALSKYIIRGVAMGGVKE